MLTPQDINLLREFFATKEDLKELATKEDIKEIKASINTLTMAVDSFAQEIKDNRTERLVVAHQMETYDRWFQMLADKVGIKLEP